jgi:hypothetical protein
MIRVVLPQHLRTLARVDADVTLEVPGPATVGALLDALEASYPVLRGTIRDHATKRRRPFLRFFACEADLSHAPDDTPLPAAVASGEEPFVILGAIAGGLLLAAPRLEGLGRGEKPVSSLSRSAPGAALEGGGAPREPAAGP